MDLNVPVIIYYGSKYFFIKGERGNEVRPCSIEEPKGKKKKFQGNLTAKITKGVQDE